MSWAIEEKQNVVSAPERQVLASQADTPPAVLSRLAADGNLHVRRAAAQHPQTPPAVLALLVRAGSSPDLMGSRPSTTALSASELEELVALGPWGRDLAARHRDAGPITLTALAAAGTGTLRRRVAKHPGCPAELLGELCGDVEAAVRVAAAAHPNVPPARIALLRAAGAEADLSGMAEAAPGSEMDFAALLAAGVYGRQLAARHPQIDPTVLAHLAEDSDWRVRAAVAENPSAEGGLLAALADLDTFETRSRIASHPHTPAAVLETLTAEHDIRLRVAVAENPGASAALLGKLALDGSSAVREAVASHPGLDVQTRERLAAAGSSADLQAFVEPDPDLDGEVLAELATHGGWGQRLAARHPATPADVLAQLITAGDPILRDLSRRHPACPASLMQLLREAGSTADLQGFEPSQTGLSAASIGLLVELGSWARRLAARHPAATGDHLARLSQEPDGLVRLAVAKNAATPTAVADAMTADVSHDVRWAVVNRADVSASALKELLRDPIPMIRLAAVEHPRTPTAALQALRFDLDEDVRAAARARG